MTLNCGIDRDSTNRVIAVLDEGGKTVFEKRLANELKTITGVLEAYGGALRKLDIGQLG